MPLYEYECGKCGATFEALVFGDEKPACEKCGSRRLKKLVSAFAVSSQETLPECRGSSPSCSRSVCESGMCPGMRQN